MTGFGLSGHSLMNRISSFGAALLVCWAASSQVSLADDSTVKAARFTTEQFRIQAYMAQLHAELEGKSSISFSPALTKAAAADPALASLLHDAQARFELIKEERQEKYAALRSRIDTAKSSIEEQQHQLTANRNRLEMVSNKLESLKPAVEKGLIGENYVTALTEEVEHLGAQCDQLEESIARIKWSVAEHSLQLTEQTSDRQRIVQAKLKALEARKRQADRFEEELVASETQLYLHSSMQ